MAHVGYKTRTRSDYKYQLDYRTRWSDNDMYHHLNNIVYGSLLDSIVNEYLKTYCGHSPRTSPEIGMVVTSHFDFFGQVAYPGVIEVGLRVNKLGKSTAAFEVGIFQQGEPDVRAVGGFTSCFVDSTIRRPRPNGMGQEIRDGLSRLLVQENAKL